MAHRKKSSPRSPLAPPDAPTAAPPAAIAFVVLAAAVLIVYGPSLDAPLVFDDAGTVKTNASIRQLWPLVGSAEHPAPLSPPKFTSTAGRPLVNLSLALNHYVSQLEPTGYHLVNVAIHVLSALLLWAIVRRTLCLPYFNGQFDRVAGPLALAVAVLWAVHPLDTEAVIYVTQRTELLMAVFYSATLYASLRYWDAGSPHARTAWLTLAIVACFAGMASKEVMVSAPVVVLLFDRTFRTGTFRTALRQSWPLYVGLACSWLVLLYLNYSGPRSDTAGFHLSVEPWAWWLTQSKVLLMYLKLAVWPWPLVIHYDIPYRDSWATAWQYVIPVAVLAAASLYLLWQRRAAGFVAACVFAILAPTLVVPITTEVAAERRMYLPLAAIVALTVVGGYWCFDRFKQSRAANARTSPRAATFPAAIGVSIVVLAIVYAVVSRQRLAAYDQELTLWADAVAYDPQNSLAQLNFAVQLDKSGHVAEAIDRYRTAIQLNPDVVESHYSLGMALLKTGQLDGAIAEFREAVRIRPASERMHNNLGAALARAGRFDEAIDAFQQALAVNPNMWRAHDNLALALQQQGDLTQAIEHFNRALEIDPEELEVYGHLADALAAANQPDQAIAVVERAVDVARAAGKPDVAERIAAQLQAFRAARPNPRSQPPISGNPSGGR